MRNSSGIPKEYRLKSFDDFTLGKPYIKNIHFVFYKNESDLISAFKNEEVTSINSIQTYNAKELSENGYNVQEYPLPRIFGVFFNQSKAPLFASKTVRTALDTAIDRDQIIQNVLNGYGNKIDGPIPSSIIPFTQLSETESSNNNFGTEKAKSILEEAGFKLNEKGVMQRETSEGIEVLSFSVSTANVPELVSAAEQVVESWKAIGADVTLKVFDPNDFNQNVIRPRNYDAILFGEVIGRDLDFYAFWHSSQRNDPGLNIADYANIDVDAVLESARQMDNGPERIEKFRIFAKEIKNDIPAVFLYSPNFIYVVPEKLKGVIPENLETPSERFLSVYNWYLETDKVWRIFN
jgi:peptide/nickel transport system substrate-binding protein